MVLSRTDAAIIGLLGGQAKADHFVKSLPNPRNAVCHPSGIRELHPGIRNVPAIASKRDQMRPRQRRSRMQLLPRIAAQSLLKLRSPDVLVGQRRA
jgi:hypothetical protein